MKEENHKVAELPKNGTGFEASPQEKAVKLDLDEAQFPNVNQNMGRNYSWVLHIPGKIIISSSVASSKLCRLESYF